MLDSYIRPVINVPLDTLGKTLARFGVTANQVTWAGFGCGMAACLALFWHFYILALALLLLNRCMDGIDGAVARARDAQGQVDGQSDIGGYLDIVLDFIFYSGFIFAFALGHPHFALMAAFLIFSFIGTGGSFLAYAIIAAKRGMDTEQNGKKSFFHASGLAEGTETILTFVLICLLPGWFNTIALIFGILCWITTIGRIKMAYRDFTG